MPTIDQTALGHGIAIDVRAIPPPKRHPLIHARFDAMSQGQMLVLTSDHEPRPLRAEFDRRYAEGFSWEQRCLGQAHWEVTIVKLGQADDPLAPEATLRRWPGFRDADDAMLAALLKRVRVVSVRRNRAAVEQGIHWPYVGLVERGVVQAVLVTPDGRELAMYETQAGELFGAVALLDGGASPLRYVARDDDTRVLLLHADDVLALGRERPAVAQALAALTAQRVRTIVERFSAHASQPIAARVADALLAYASPSPGLVDALPELRAVRQVELAVAAGTGKDIVYRAIAELEAAGALKRTHGKITHLNREKLTEYAGTMKY